MLYTLSDRDFEFFSQMIYQINSLSGYHNISTEALKQLKLVIPFDKGKIFRIRQPEPGVFEYFDPASLNPDGQTFDEQLFMKGEYDSDCLIYVASPWSKTFRSNDVRSEQEFLNSRLYKDVYQPQNIYYGLVSILIHRNQRVAILGLFRSKDKGDFTDRELFLLKSLAPHLELKLYSELFGARRIVPDEFAEYMDELSGRYVKKFGLTKRETEVLQLLCRGCGNDEISERFGISRSTLNKHLHNLYHKLEVKNRVQLIRRYMDEMSEFIQNS